MEPLAAPTAVELWIGHRERVRKLRMQRHLAVALLTGLMVPFVAPALETLPGVVLLSLLVFAVLNSLGRAVDARIGYLWGWLYGEPHRISRLDQLVDTMIRRLGSAGRLDDVPAKVRPI